MRKINYFVICDICNKEQEVKSSEFVPDGWFLVDIRGNERREATTDERYCSSPPVDTVLVSVSTKALCCSRKCAKECVDELLKRKIG